MGGLVASVATAPVRAEEAAAEAAAPAATEAPPAPAKKSAVEENKLDAAKRAAAPSKEERLKASVAEMAAQPQVNPDASLVTGASFKTKSSKNKRGAIIKDGETSSQQGQKSSASSSAPSFEGATIVSTEEGKKKVIISPADAMDEDEMPLSRSNWPALVAVIFTPTLIYLAFWVLGSLEVI